MEVQITTVNGKEYYHDVIDIQPYIIEGFTQFVCLTDSETNSLKQRIIRNTDIIELTILSDDY